MLAKDYKQIYHIMAFLKKIKPATLKLTLFFFVVSIFCVISAVFFWHREISEHPEKLLKLLPNDADISIGGVYQESLRNGIKEWSLNAVSADYFEKNNTVKFNDLYLTFFLEDGEKVIIQADKGILRTDTNNIEVDGNVIITSKNYKLVTEKILYDHKRRIIFSKTHVHITGDSFDLKADAMSHDLKTDKASLEGMVTGELNEKIVF